MNNLKQHNEDVMKKFVDEFGIHFKDSPGELQFAQEFISDSLKGQLEVVEEIQKDKVNVLIKRHKEKACTIANSAEYDEVNMNHYVENPIIRSLVCQHIDSVRELTAFTTPLLAELNRM